MTDKEKIRAEIIQRYKGNKADGYSDVCCELWDLLAFIDSMPEEPKFDEEPASDLEEEIKQYLNKEVIVTNEDVVISKHHEFHNFYVENLEEVACHFANWQKQQMMKDAVEVTITGDCAIIFPKAIGENGDKVKLIIIKNQ